MAKEIDNCGRCGKWIQTGGRLRESPNGEIEVVCVDCLELENLAQAAETSSPDLIIQKKDFGGLSGLLRGLFLT